MFGHPDKFCPKLEQPVERKSWHVKNSKGKALDIGVLPVAVEPEFLPNTKAHVESLLATGAPIEVVPKVVDSPHCVPDIGSLSIGPTPITTACAADSSPLAIFVHCGDILVLSSKQKMLPKKTKGSKKFAPSKNKYEALASVTSDEGTRKPRVASLGVANLL
ncbi:hypothetical protein V6N12_002727 [Hibiscus sabdariffa]|uniref:Uncharacterized protein n=1 Tax=Hibiscus sabdariffa TaxID=183260 RepID=A0ABR2E9V1_9ROSI